ncbi:DUF3263 domain-containing protein [Brevibacterium album]|uniref:DUF3263 domain-containing protein n=1 Tax=Brevibacterium album TaxID=417948 RepID=UPI0003FD83E0|nr:DUF3263 domain-containing protein [Brevibacterium album]
MAEERKDSAESQDGTAGLSDRDREILEFERTWFTYGGAKDHAIRERFDMSAGAYFQRLAALLDDPAAYAHDPVLIKRLRRIRDGRQRNRSHARVAR